MSAWRIRRFGAFTIVELLVAIVIIMILAGIAMLAWNLYVHRAGIAACEAGTKQVADMISAQAAVNSEVVSPIVATPTGPVGQGVSDYASLRYGMSIPADAQKVSLVENADHTRLDLTVEFRDFVAQGLYYNLGEPGSVAHGTLSCGDNPDGGGGGTDPGVSIVYPGTPVFPSPVDPGNPGVCPTLTEVNGAAGPYTYSLDPASETAVSAAGVVFDPATGCFKVVSSSGVAFTDTVTYRMGIISYNNPTYGTSCGIGADTRVYCWGKGFTTAGVAQDPVLLSDVPAGASSLTAYDQFACAVSEGKAYCWGENYSNYGDISGYMGPLLARTTQGSTPAPVETSAGVALTGVTKVFAGNSGGCALVTGGDLYCWPGSDRYAHKVTEVGPGTVVGPVRSVSLIGSLCVVGTDGEGWCWDSDTNQRIGAGNTWSLLDLTVPNLVPLQSAATDVVATSANVCFLLDSSRVQCAGANDYGQVGQGVLTKVWPWSTVVQSSEGVALSGVRSLSGMEDSFCAVLDDQTVSCWGDQTGGGLGNLVTSTTPAPYPVKVVDGPSGGVLSGVASVSMSGQQEACAVKVDGSAWCWGRYNTSGQLGDGTTTPRPYPVHVYGTGGTHVDNVVVTVVSQSDASLTASYSNLDLAASPLYTPLTPGSPSSVEYSQTLLYDYSTIVPPDVASSSPGSYVFSTNKSGQDLSDANLLFDSASGQFASRFRFDKYDQVAVTGHYHRMDPYPSGGEGKIMAACGLSDGLVKCWGYRETDAPTVTYALEDTTKLVPLPDRAIRLYGDGSSTCALLASRQVWCWGVGSAGVDSFVDAITSPFAWSESSPRAVTVDGDPLDNVISFGKGGGTACAVSGSSASASSGQLYCWGINTNGQTGIGEDSYAQDRVSMSPGYHSAVLASEVMSTVGPVSMVATGSSASCVVDSAGQPWCWGVDSDRAGTDQYDGDYGYTPKPVVGLPGPATAIEMSGMSACALSEGEVWCWGPYVNGVSDPARVQASTGELSAVTTLVSVDAAGYCVIAGANAEALCWGKDMFGTMGNGWDSNASSSSDTGNGSFGEGQVLASPVWASADGSVTLKSVTSISAAYPKHRQSHDWDRGGGCASVADGTVWCWGMANDYYFLGDETTTGRAYAAPAKQTGPYPTLEGIVVTATGVTTAASQPFTIRDASGAGSVGLSGKPGVPATLTATPGDTVVDLSWSAVPSTLERPVSGYRVFRWNSSLRAYQQVGQVSSLSFTDELLQNGTAYTYAVSAYGDLGQGRYSAAVAATPFGRPSAPSAVTVKVADGGVVLSWTKPSANGSPVTDYLVDFRPVGDLDWVRVDDGSSTAVTVLVSSLDNGVGYEFRVSAVNAVGVSAWSPTASGTPAAVPPAPASLSVVASSGRADLSWSTVSGTPQAPVSGYRVFRSTGGSYTEVYQGPDTSWLNTGLVNGTNYSYYVAAYGPGGQGLASPVQAVIPVGVPGVPRSPLVAAVGAGAFLSWTAPASDGGSAVTGYSVNYRKVGDPSYATFVTGLAGTSVQVEPLQALTAYEFQVWAVNGEGPGPAVVVTLSASPTGLPSSPTGVTASSVSSAAWVSWTPPVDEGSSAVSSYTARAYSSSSGGSERGVACQAVAPATSCKITGLTNGTTYYVFVLAVNDAGASAPSSPRVSVAVAAHVPAAPAAPVVSTTPGVFGGFTLSWPDPVGLEPLTGQSVFVATSSGMTSLSSFSGCSALDGFVRSCSLVVSSPVASDTLYFRLKATNVDGTSAYSTYATALTQAKPGVPPPPTVTATYGTYGGFHVSWNPVVDVSDLVVDGYQVVVSSSSSTYFWQNENTFTGCGSLDGAATSCNLLLDAPSAGNTYYFKLAVHTAAGWSTWSSNGSALGGDSPGTPADPSAVIDDSGYGAFTVSWSAPASDGGLPVDGYEIAEADSGSTYFWQNEKTFTGCAPLSGATLSCRAVVDAPSSGQVAYFRVRAHNLAGWSPWSGSSTVAYMATVPAEPAAPSAVIDDSGYGAFTVSWAAPSNGGLVIDSYEIRESSASGLSFTSNMKSFTGCTSLTGSDLSCRAVVSTPTSGQPAYFEVRAHNQAGWSLWSNYSTVANMATVPAEPAAPSGVAVYNSFGEFTVSWTAPSNGGLVIDSYEIREADANGTNFTANIKSFTGCTSLTGSDRSCNLVVSTPTSNQNAYFEVRAHNQAGWSLWSNYSTVANMASVPATMAVPSVSHVYDTLAEFTVSWTAPSNGGLAIDSYEIREADANGSNFVSNLKPFTGCSPLSVSDLSCTAVVSTPTSNQNAYFEVRAHNQAGWSAWSNYSAVANMAAVPGTVSTPTVTAQSGGKFTVSWAVPTSSGASLDSYEIGVFSSSSNTAAGYVRTFTGCTPLTGSSSSCQLTLSPYVTGNSYIRVKAHNLAGWSSWSSARSAAALP